MICVITGQTATGKTALALELAKKYNGELLNFDSRQVYKYLDIITGKDLSVIKNLKSKIWLCDVVAPNQYFSSHDWVVKATKIIDKVRRRGKTPILVGGTYLYLRHLLYGFDVTAPPNFPLRKKLELKSVKELQEKLKKLDLKTWEKLNYSDRNNPRRLMRKIEIADYNHRHPELVSGPSMKGSQTKFEMAQFIGLRFKNNDDLKQAIVKRVKMRLKEGAIQEVKKILKRGYKETDPGLKTIGYQELIMYLNGKISKEKAIVNWINHEVQYAKRQYTFMKRDNNITWREI